MYLTNNISHIVGFKVRVELHYHVNYIEKKYTYTNKMFYYFV